MSQAVVLGKTLERLYAAALDSSRWREALTAIEDFTGSTGAVVDLIPLDDSTRPMTFAGSFSSEDCAEYALHYQAICPRIAFAVAHPEIETQFDRLILSESEMDRDPVYDWFGKHGLRYYVAGCTGRTKYYQAFASLQRSRKQGHVDSEDIARFEMVRPHLTQALTLADTLGTLSTHRRFGDAILNALPQGVFGLANDGTLLFTNESAERLLTRGSCLVLEGRRLRTADSTQQAEFEKLLGSALTAPIPHRGGRLLIRRRGGGLPFAARVTRILGDSIELAIRPGALLIVNDPEAAAAIDEPSLRELYGLTAGESRVAAALLHGHSLQSAAHYLGSSVETLRCHLKSVFRKVGVSRQQDLVRMLAELEMSSIAGAAPDHS